MIEIRFGRGNGDSSFVAGGVNMQIAIVNNSSCGEVIRVPILLPVTVYLIPVTKLRDQNVRHDNSALHVQGWYRSCERPRLQIELNDNQRPRYCLACY